MGKRGKVVHGELVAFRLPKALRRELERLAEADRRTFSDYVRLALEAHVQKAQRPRK